MIPIKDLKEGDSIRDRYAVRHKETPRDYRNREGKYFFFTVGDRNSEIGVKYWGAASSEKTMSVYKSFKNGDVVEITGDVEFDRFTEKLIIRMNEDQNTIRLCSPDEYDIASFLPTSNKDLDKLYTQLLERMRDIKQPELQELVAQFLMDDEIAGKYRTSPSSMVHHHNYLGGHLEHVLEVLALCDSAADFHVELDRDLLAAGAILYDIGKLSSYTYTASIDMTDEGQFIGHVALGYNMVKERLDEVDCPPETAMKLLHIILSHHGDSEKYSTRRFKIPEACVLHHADSMSAQIQEFLSEMEAEGEEGDWAYSRKLGHQIYRGD